MSCNIFLHDSRSGQSWGAERIGNCYALCSDKNLLRLSVRHPCLARCHCLKGGGGAGLRSRVLSPSWCCSSGNGCRCLGYNPGWWKTGRVGSQQWVCMPVIFDSWGRRIRGVKSVGGYNPVRPHWTGALWKGSGGLHSAWEKTDRQGRSVCRSGLWEPRWLV